MNLRHYFAAAIQRAPDAVAVVDHRVRWTYRDLAHEVEQVAAGLWSLGLRSGDRVMVLLRNRREHVVIFWACQYLGLVYVPVSHRFAANDIMYCIEDAEPEALFFDEASAATIAFLAERTVLPTEVYTVEIQKISPFKRFEQLYQTTEPPPSMLTGATIFNDDAIAVMLYSSGATGTPKGIPRSHLNEVSATLAHIIHNRYSPGESTLAVSAFCHTMGLRMLLAMTFLNGKLVLPLDDTPATYAAFLAQEHISCLYAFPNVYHDLLAELHGYDVGALKKIAYAGDAMSSQLVRQCTAQFALEEFVNHYGSTEIYTYTICSWLARKPSCAGKAGIHTELRLVTPSHTSLVEPDDIVARGEVGELIVRLSSPEAFRGYWNRPDLTTQALRQGWYFTGDLVRMDEDGDLWVVGRVDDMIISGLEVCARTTITRDGRDSAPPEA